MKQLKPLTWFDYLWVCGIPALLSYIACQIAIPYLKGNNNLPIEIVCFLCVGGIALAPMFFMAIYFARKETRSATMKQVLARMRIKRLSGKDWLLTIITFVLLCASSFLIARVLMPKAGRDVTPFFFQNMPLQREPMYILYVWPAIFFFNILGEGFIWRGCMQPRQELQLGMFSWLVHGVLWAVWHLPMVLDVIFAASPIFLILPAVVQFRQNTSIAIVVHAIFGAFGFLAIALGGLY
jgi:hypothetical protein